MTDGKLRFDLSVVRRRS